MECRRITVGSVLCTATIFLLLTTSATSFIIKRAARQPAVHAQVALVSPVPVVQRVSRDIGGMGVGEAHECYAGDICAFEVYDRDTGDPEDWIQTCRCPPETTCTETSSINLASSVRNLRCTSPVRIV